MEQIIFYSGRTCTTRFSLFIAILKRHVFCLADVTLVIKFDKIRIELNYILVIKIEKKIILCYLIEQISIVIDFIDICILIPNKCLTGGEVLFECCC